MDKRQLQIIIADARQKLQQTRIARKRTFWLELIIGLQGQIKANQKNG